MKNYKQNVDPNPTPMTARSNRKYIYGQTQYAQIQQNSNLPTVRQPKPQSNMYTSNKLNFTPSKTSSNMQRNQTNEQGQSVLQARINKLQYQLNEQRKKSKQIQENTIREQTKVLEQIQVLQARFMQVENEKKQMQKLMQESCRQIQQYKKVKNVAQAMVSMMNKIQGTKNKGNETNNDYHEAWRWIKKVVWQYETIKKKGLQWKKAYDILKQHQLQNNRKDTFNQDNSYNSQYQY